MNPYKYELQNVWTLQEVVSIIKGSSANAWDTTTFYSLFKTIYPNAPLWNGTASKDYIEDLWELTFARFLERYALKTSNLITTLTVPLVTPVVLKIVNIIVSTYPRYSVLLKAYTDKIANMMDKIESTALGATRFNDTPQDGGDFASDPYTTNITETTGTSETDGGSPMQRLKELQDGYQNVLTVWSNEFDKIFMEGGNIQEL